MKRLLPLLLLLCLLLTACTPTNPPTEPSATTEPTAEMPTETESTTAPSETEPTQLGVQVDFSQYTPPTAVETKYTRLSEGPLDHLEPTDSPTRIFPFPGNLLIDAYGGLYITEDRFNYGIIDETGCILADPVYSYVYLLTGEDTREALPYWILERVSYKTVVEEDYEYTDTDTLCAFASIDGTFVSDCVYEVITAYEDRILAFYPTEEEQPLRFDVYDLDHELLFSSHSLSFRDKLGGGPYLYTYAEGLYTVAFESRTYAPEGYYTVEYSHYYMDEDGDLVLGPYYDPSPFSHGKAAVRLTEDSNYVFIDKNGAVLSGEYSSYKFLPNGNVIVPEEGNVNDHHDILDENLEYINFLPGYYFLTADGSIQVYDRFSNEYCYTRDGEQLWCRANARFISSEFCEYNTEEGSFLEHIPTGKTYKLPEYAHCQVIGDPKEPIIIVNTYNSNSEEVHIYLNKELEELDIAVDTQAYMSYYEIGHRSHSVLGLSNNDGTTVYKDSHSPLATYPVKDCRMADLYPGEFATLTNTECTYLFSPDGRLLFAYPISPMDD